MAETVRRLHSNPWFSVDAREAGEQIWYRVVRADSAMVVGSAVDGRVLMLRGRRDTTGSERLLEFPCGGIEEGETPETAAVRETLEESGFLASGLSLLGTAVEAPGLSSSTCHIFRARLHEHGAPMLEAGEDWVVEMLTLREVRAAIAAGWVRDAGSLAAFALLAATEE